MIDLTPIFQSLIMLAATLITAFVIPFLKSRFSNEQLDRMKAWAEIGVKAAEQIYNGPGNGEAKMKYVLAFLRDHGYTLAFEELEALIESTVNNMKNEQGFIVGEEI